MKISKIGLSSFNQVNFTRTLKEHKSWGARVNPETKDVSFKLFTYPDTQAAKVLLYGSSEQDDVKEIPLENKGNGVFEVKGVSNSVAKSGDKYEYEFERQNGEIQRIKDPYTFKQETVNGPSVIYDQSEFEWKNDKKWKTNPNRIVRTAGAKSKYNSPQDARIYALSPDTFTDKRSYEGVIDKLKEIKKLGFNAVEVMHVENTFSFNWGYDGVDKHAPSSYLGGPDSLKKLVDAIHGEGMNVIFDVVPNHLGPDGNQLGRSGPYIKGANDFGDALNYEGENSQYVRDYMANAMLNWAENYHVDGLRLDMTKYMESDYTLKQIAAEMNYHYPDVFLIAEDGRANVSVDENGHYWYNQDEVHDKRVTSPVKPEECGKGKSQKEHAERIQDIDGKINTFNRLMKENPEEAGSFIRNDSTISNLGMNSEWDFNFYHELDESLYFPQTDGIIKAILNSQNNVKYIASHDEIGNYEGTRKLAKLMVPKLRLNENVVLNRSDIERAKEYASLKNKPFEEALRIITCQKAQFVSEALAVQFQSGELDKYEQSPDMTPDEINKTRNKFKEDVLIPLGIDSSSHISYKKIEKSFEEAFSQNKMAHALTYAIPGPKMTFQGDENLDLTPFRFFRKFESVPYEDYLYTEKGYAPAEAALQESTLGKIEYSPNGKKRMEEYNNLVKDLNKLNAENSALRLGKIEETSVVDHPMSAVIGVNAIDGENEIFTVTNFSDINYREDKYNEYYLKFPKGKWVEVLNTDDIKYGGDGRHKNTEVISSDGNINKPINLAGYSTICFKRVG